jgi:hypothetical protein
MIFPAQYAYSQTWWFKVMFLVIAGANALIFETKMGGRMAALQPGEDRLSHSGRSALPRTRQPFRPVGLLV